MSGEESGAQIALRARRLQVEAQGPEAAGRNPAREDPRHPGRPEARSGGDRLDPDPVFRCAHRRRRGRSRRCASARPSSRASPSRPA